MKQRLRRTPFSPDVRAAIFFLLKNEYSLFHGNFYASLGRKKNRRTREQEGMRLCDC